MNYTNRADYAATGEHCRRSRTCQLRGGHGGHCDARPEEQRWRDLFAAIDDQDAPPESGTQARRERRAG